MPEGDYGWLEVSGTVWVGVTVAAEDEAVAVGAVRAAVVESQ